MNFTISIEGTDLSVPAAAGETVLDALLAADVPFAYSCQAGNCGTCRCELISGEILELEYSEHALSVQERERQIVLACRSQVWGDVTVRRLDAEEFMVHPSRVMLCRVAEKVMLTHDIVGLRLNIETGGPYSFSAGQYARLATVDAPDLMRDYSMANSPDDPTLEFHIRTLSGGKVSHRLAQLQAGDPVRVSGPSGTSYLRAQHGGPMLAVAGGSGFAPIRSIVDTALKRVAGQQIHVYLGVRAVRDVYGLPIMERWRRCGVRVHVVLSESNGEAGPYRTGLVTDAVAMDLPDLTGFKAYVAGPPPMVEAVTGLLRARGVPSRDVHADAFYPAAGVNPQRSPLTA
jgi:CDP-4-dehydro-6-deoxyglucose reductase/ferredoxin-NAD(P)+ reductase (naphthalene dioxygenase ferredoxin-specific)